MEEQLISFETAKLAKERGFNLKVPYHYTEYGRVGEEWKDGIEGRDVNFNNRWTYKAWSAPTQALLQKWLREKYDMNVIAFPYTNEGMRTTKYRWVIYNQYLTTDNDIYETYEMAFEKGLIHALKLIYTLKLI